MRGEIGGEVAQPGLEHAGNRRGLLIPWCPFGEGGSSTAPCRPSHHWPRPLRILDSGQVSGFVQLLKWPGIRHTPPLLPGVCQGEIRGYPRAGKRPRRLAHETDETGIHQGIGRDRRRAGRRLRDDGDEIPVTSAMALRKAKPAGPAKGEWVATTCQGCTQWCAIQIFVQDGRATRVRGNPLSKTNHGYVCPRGHLIPQQVYDPDRIKVPMKRTNPAKGRGVDPKFVPITWDEALDTVADKMIDAAQGERDAQVRLHARPLFADLHGPALRHAAEGLRHAQLLLAQRHLRRSREDGPRPHPGLLRLPRLRPRQDQVPGRLGLRPAGLQPHGAQRHPPLRRDPEARHGDRGRPAPVQRRPPRRRSGCRSSRAPTARSPAPSPT